MIIGVLLPLISQGILNLLIVGMAIDILQPFGHLLDLLSVSRFILTMHLIGIPLSACLD